MIGRTVKRVVTGLVAAAAAIGSASVAQADPPPNCVPYNSQYYACTVLYQGPDGNWYPVVELRLREIYDTIDP